MPPSWPSRPVHQRVEGRHRALSPSLGRERADGVDDGRDHRREAVEGAEQAEEDQQVDQVAREVALLLDARRRPTRGSSASRTRSATAGRGASASSAASGASRRGALVNSWPGRSSAKPSIQFTEEISVSTCQKQASDADEEDEEDEDLEVGRGEEDLLDRREEQHRDRRGQAEDDQHHHDLADRLRELRFGPVTEHHRRKSVPSDCRVATLRRGVPLSNRLVLQHNPP